MISDGALGIWCVGDLGVRRIVLIVGQEYSDEVIELLVGLSVSPSGASDEQRHGCHEPVRDPAAVGGRNLRVRRPGAEGRHRRKGRHLQGSLSRLDL